MDAAAADDDDGTHQLEICLACDYGERGKTVCECYMEQTA